MRSKDPTADWRFWNLQSTPPAKSVTRIVSLYLSATNENLLWIQDVLQPSLVSSFLLPPFLFGPIAQQGHQGAWMLIHVGKVHVFLSAFICLPSYPSARFAPSRFCFWPRYLTEFLLPHSQRIYLFTQGCLRQPRENNKCGLFICFSSSVGTSMFYRTRQ